MWFCNIILNKVTFHFEEKVFHEIVQKSLNKNITLKEVEIIKQNDTNIFYNISIEMNIEKRVDKEIESFTKQINDLTQNLIGTKPKNIQIIVS